MYCGINEVWGPNFNNSETVENFTSWNQDKEYQTFLRLKEKFGGGNNNIDNADSECSSVNEYCKLCSECRRKAKRNRYGRKNVRFNLDSEIFDSFSDISDSLMDRILDLINDITKNKDLITLVLVCVLMVLIFKFLNK